MPIFNLIQAFTPKYSQTYSSFLGAYNEVKQMRNIKNNLAAMAHCILSEHSEGESRCLDYYVNSGADRTVFHLNSQEDLEPFYISVFPLFSENYLRSDFWKTVWKYGKFNRLCKYYCERCVAYSIFNEELACYLMESSTLDPLVREGLVIVCEMEIYPKWLEDMGFAFMVINRINSLVETMSEDSISLLNFSCYYEDRSSADILNHVAIHLKSTATAIHTVCSTDMLVYNSDRVPEDSSPGLSNCGSVPFAKQSVFLLGIFRNVKSRKIRFKVLEECCNVFKSNGKGMDGLFADFIVECIKLDPDSVSRSLCKPMANTWSPLLVSRYFAVYDPKSHNSSCAKTSRNISSPLEVGDCGHSLNDSGETSHTAYLGGENWTVFRKVLVGMCGGDLDFVNICIGMSESATGRIKRRDASLLDTIMASKITDPRVFVFLYCVDKPLFFNHFVEIHELLGGNKVLSMVAADMVQQ